MEQISVGDCSPAPVTSGPITPALVPHNAVGFITECISGLWSRLAQLSQEEFSTRKGLSPNVISVFSPYKRLDILSLVTSANSSTNYMDFLLQSCEYLTR